MNRNRFLRLVMFLLLAVTPLFAQEQTSSIQGTVTDPSGAVLPGVTVEARRGAGGAPFTVQTDSEGRYRFPSLQPGTYQVSASLSGMESATVKNVEAKLGTSPRVDLQLRLSAVAETISVTAEAPLVDVTSSATAASITSETFERLPRGRDFTTVVTQAASANQDSKAGGITIDGASGSENRYVLDGVDVTNPQTGVAGKVVITDFIDEVQVKSAGYAAEFGGATGGVINVITKTGTNDFAGTASVYYTDSAFAGDRRPILDLTTANNPSTGRPDAAYYTFDNDDVTNIEPGFTIGGPVVRDRLWFFGAYQPIIENRSRDVAFRSTANPANPSQPFPASNTFEQEFRRENYAGTLSGSLGTKFLYKFSGNNSGYTEEDLLPGILGTASANPAAYTGVEDELENWTLSGYGDFVPNQTWLLSLRGGRFYRNFTQSGYSDDPRIAFLANSPSMFPGVPSNLALAAGFATIPTNTQSNEDSYTRDNLYFDVSWFPQWAGTHRIKGGVQVENLSNSVQSGFQNHHIRAYWGRTNRFNSNTGPYGTTEVYKFETVGDVESNNLGFFIQDSWTTMNDRLTINAGVRTERERVPNYGDPTLGNVSADEYAIEFDFSDKIAPRLGFSYDIAGNGRWKAYGSYGTFYDITKMEMPRGSFGGDRWILWSFLINDYDWTKWSCQNVTNNPAITPTCTGMTLDPDFPRGIDLRHPSNNPEHPTIDPNLKPMESREYTIGLQHELTNTIALGARYVKKQLIRTIEDVGVFNATTGSEDFFIANPGEGVARSILGANFPDFPKPKRDYDGLELEFTKRFVNRWMLHASYVYSRLYGNYSGLANSDEAQATAGVARTSPNVNRFGDSLFNMFDASGSGEPVYGRLATDRPHQFKAQAVYAFPFGTSLGVNQYVGSGTPFSTEYNFHGVPFFPYGRGDLGRSPTLTQTDLLIQHDVRLFGNYALQLGVNVLNLFDEDTETNYNDVFSSSNVNPCRTAAGTVPSGCDADLAFFKGFDPFMALPRSSTNPAQVNPAALNQQYGMANAFQAAREVRFHVKFIF